MDYPTIFLTLGIAFSIAILLGPLVIPILEKIKFGQQVRTEGPQTHFKKSGTPTMGGLIILFAMLISFMKFSEHNFAYWALMIGCLGYGLIGFLDDYIKVAFGRSLGLTPLQKLSLQLVFAGIFCYFLILMNHSTVVDIPGTNLSLNLGWAYYLFVIIIFLGTTNAVNFTDGLDGLLGGTSVIAFGAFAIIAITLSHQSVAFYCTSIIGAILGFLVYNVYPAKVFMGDTGSLALGGGLAAVAILMKTELLLMIIGGIFVIEMLSVVLQVGSFKLRKKRVFKMSPIHHHFELSGWSEWKVVTIFWFVSLCLACVGLLLFKIS